MAIEKRLIDANALTDNFSFLRKMWSGTEIMTVIDETPTADAVEVVHGRWIKKAAYNDGVINTVACSACGDFQPIGSWDYYNYCPHCGAKMDK